MGFQRRILFVGFMFILAGGGLANEVRAQTPATELILNNSIIHPDEPVPPEVHFCFSDNDLTGLAGQDGVGVIVHHGKQLDLSDYAKVYSHTERLDFFTSQLIDPSRFTPEMVRAILTGQVTTWADLGGDDVEIRVYQPAQDLKKDAIAAQLARAGILMDVAGEERSSYADLAMALEEDPGAFVMGLRSEAAWEENLPDAQKLVPMTEAGLAAFAMPIQIYVRMDDPTAEYAAGELLSVVGDRAVEDRMEYPVADKMEALAAQ